MMPHPKPLENSAAAILVGVSAITLAAIYHVDETVEFHQLHLVGHDMILASTVDNGKRWSELRHHTFHHGGISLIGGINQFSLDKSD